MFDGNKQDISMELSISPHFNTDAYKPLMHQFRARLYLAIRQLKNAKREVKDLSQSLSQPPQGMEAPDTSYTDTTHSPTLYVAAIFLRSNYEFLRCNTLHTNYSYLFNFCISGNHRKSLKLLNTAPRTPFLTDCGECLPSIYFCNVASCHAMMGKHTLAAFYFKKALEENDRALTGTTPYMDMFVSAFIFYL